MKLTRRDLQLAELWEDLRNAAPVILALVVAGLTIIMVIWGRP